MRKELEKEKKQLEIKMKETIIILNDVKNYQLTDTSSRHIEKAIKLIQKSIKREFPKWKFKEK